MWRLPACNATDFAALLPGRAGLLTNFTVLGREARVRDALVVMNG